MALGLDLVFFFIIENYAVIQSLEIAVCHIVFLQNIGLPVIARNDAMPYPLPVLSLVFLQNKNMQKQKYK